MKYRIYDKVKKEYCDERYYINQRGLINHKLTDQEDFLCENYIIEQSTGLKDVNGKEICRNEDVTFTYNGFLLTGVVLWDGFRHYIEECKLKYKFTLDESYEDYEIKIIGNVHEDKLW